MTLCGQSLHLLLSSCFVLSLFPLLVANSATFNDTNLISQDDDGAKKFHGLNHNGEIILGVFVGIGGFLIVVLSVYICWKLRVKEKDIDDIEIPHKFYEVNTDGKVMTPTIANI